ncbi:MAG: preprotein translocase subunit SecE [Clostridiales bacterium]|jgi:preprotein translocase subunit SecE|nr:preprotein translocase subunit SecE [Clostridiales bacterium]
MADKTKKSKREKKEIKEEKSKFKRILLTFKRIILVPFRKIKEIYNELKKVSWPDRSQLFKNTVSVLVYCVIIGAVIWIIDALLNLLLKYIYQ